MSNARVSPNFGSGRLALSGRRKGLNQAAIPGISLENCVIIGTESEKFVDAVNTEGISVHAG